MPPLPVFTSKSFFCCPKLADNFIRKTKEGFVFSIEFGSRYYYNFKFYFNLYKGNFYLNKVFETSFDKYNTSKKNKSSLKLIKPVIRFDKFNIHNYTDDF